LLSPPLPPKKLSHIFNLTSESSNENSTSVMSSPLGFFSNRLGPFVVLGRFFVFFFPFHSKLFGVLCFLQTLSMVDRTALSPSRNTLYLSPETSTPFYFHLRTPVRVTATFIFSHFFCVNRLRSFHKYRLRGTSPNSFFSWFLPSNQPQGV